MSDQPQRIQLELDQQIATLTLNIPERHNALANEDVQSIIAHLNTVTASRDIRVLIITGNGEKTFCAGAALDQMGSGALNGDVFATMTDKVAGLAIPTICAFNGSAYGGGSELGLACDFRIGVNGMRVFVPPARIGLCYPVNGIERFVSVLGINMAKRMLLASEEFEAPQLLAQGYLTHLVDKTQLTPTARELAERIANYAPLALQAMKDIANQAARGQLNRAQAQALHDACNASQDLQEGFASVQEKRRPVFKGH
ncbi:enoyl-CoA hydratase/isomerase family protein [Aestuariicella hydrocarbonica]|uniref:Enoyl-CoA hydratase/isomerase family protein n=1 Tax=Pseudomaricurvus hydrocarbonicus TaxID=1470433 RepID=A0A9E5MJF9_9GAMM|nr:enoyl-CoA hydratase-related protein [Aestuariicella hydrocarbonica]NHO65064.1 enoyl-CoA hydratase/isomerase family protein [Aestuariicella hydrocarbonica]